MVISVLRSGSYLRLYLATLLAQLGAQVARIGLLLHVVGETGGVTGPAALVAAEALPLIALSPWSGLWADRLDKQRVLQWANLTRLACVVGLVAAPRAGWLTVYLMVFFHESGQVLFEPARSALVPELLPARMLSSANALERGASHLILIVGPAFGAWLFTRLGLAPTLAVTIGCYGLIAALLAVCPGPRGCRIPNADAGEPAAPGGLMGGLRYLAQAACPRLLVALSFLSLLATGLWWPLVAFFIRDFLHAPAELLGVQTSVFGVGGLCGALLSPALSRRWGEGAMVLSALLGEGLTMLAYSLCPDPRASTALCFAWGIVVSCALVPFQTILQKTVAPDHLGRVFALVRQSESLAVLLAMGVAVPLSRLVSVPSLYGLFALIYLTGVLASFGTTGARSLLKIT